MKRTPIVVTATLAGLVGVLAFHTTQSPVSVGTLPAAPAGSQPTTPAAGSGSPRPSGQPGRTRTVDGSSVNYDWGVLSVSVTVRKGKITKVGIASLNDGGNPRSQLIDQQSLPILEQQAIQAQSTNIQGVSGASYTSAGFEQSLQSALRTLGL
jgi:uncharacterized protein with FMN-binding domain